MILLYLLLAVLSIFALYVAFLFLCSLFVDTSREYTRHSLFYRSLLNGATGLGLRILRIHVHVTGIEKVPWDTRLLFVGNHRSNFDPIITWYIFRDWKIAYLSKEENFHIPIFGRFIRRCCFMAIDREDARAALKTINNAARLLQKGEVAVGVYPEGTRSKEGILLPFHNGVLKIAQKAQAPIVVLSLVGTEKIAKNVPLRPSHVYLDVVEVIPADQVCQSTSRALGEEIYQHLDQQINQTEEKGVHR